MKLDILTPEKKVFSGEVESVTLPGTLGMFTVLEHHAPMISSLRDNGKLSYVASGKRTTITISGGFVEVIDNTVSVCADAMIEPETTVKHDTEI